MFRPRAKDWDQGKVFVPDKPKLTEHGQSIRKVDLFVHRRLQIVRVDADRTQVMICGPGCEWRAVGRLLPKAAPGRSMASK
jgi:hypothetical protein